MKAAARLLIPAPNARNAKQEGVEVANDVSEDFRGGCRAAGFVLSNVELNAHQRTVFVYERHGGDIAFVHLTLLMACTADMCGQL